MHPFVALAGRARVTRMHGDADAKPALTPPLPAARQRLRKVQMIVEEVAADPFYFASVIFTLRSFSLSSKSFSQSP